MNKYIKSAVLLLSLIATMNATSFYPPFKVAIMPNEPQDKGIVKEDTIKSINAHHVLFNIFTGDTKSGKEKCTDEIIGKNLIDYLDKLNIPTLYSVGDNEWTDCHRTSNGSYDPLERLLYIRKVFFSKNTMQGRNPFKVEREGKLGDKFSENSRFTVNNVMFVALHVVGSNNNLVSTKKLCTKHSNRSEEDCKKASNEYSERTKANIKWLKESFKIARENHLSGIAIAIQADPYFPFELSDHGWSKKFLPNLNEKNGFTNFIKTMIKETYSFKGQVVLIHGDSHYFKVDKAMFDKNGGITPNFTRVETFGSIEQSWIEMNVDPNNETIFTFKPIILKNIKER